MASQTAKVTMYRTEYCPFCVAAARLLDGLGVNYETVSLDDHPDRHSVTNTILPGHYTVPLVVVDDQPIGGYQELAALHADDELRSMLFGGAA